MADREDPADLEDIAAGPEGLEDTEEGREAPALAEWDPVRRDRPGLPWAEWAIARTDPRWVAECPLCRR